MTGLSRFAVLPLALLLAGCPPRATCTPPASRVLPVPLRGQLTGMWCWAASGQMTMNYIHAASNVTQPDEANRRFGRTDCGNSPTPTACIQGGWPEYEKYNFTRVRTSDTALTWSQLRQEIGCAGRPFAFSWHWPGGGGHMMVAIGYRTTERSNWVLVNDPWPPTSGNQVWMLYSRYVATPGDHTHWDDFYQIRYTGR
jgi:papain like cysteine protease AvrRpt2